MKKLESLLDYALNARYNIRMHDQNEQSDITVYHIVVFREKGFFRKRKKPMVVDCLHTYAKHCPNTVKRIREHLIHDGLEEPFDIVRVDESVNDSKQAK